MVQDRGGYTLRRLSPNVSRGRILARLVQLLSLHLNITLSWNKQVE